jgi:hypothetical protein
MDSDEPDRRGRAKTMLKEFIKTRQVSNEYRTRLFTDSYFDLYVWMKREQNMIIGFRLCYDKEGCFRSLTWDNKDGFYHDRINVGDNPGLLKQTPILIPDGIFKKENIIAKFKEESKEIDPVVRDFVIHRLSEYNEKEKNIFA